MPRRSSSSSRQDEPQPKKLCMFDQDCGIIMKIELKDFMCHEEFTWEPKPHINFITGSNGAGKSSLLQAIVLGLAGDAKTCKRYSKMTSFVGNDAQKAEIKIELNNKGEDGYKQSDYGDKIIFHRTIRKSGQTMLKIKNQYGAVVKAKCNVRQQARLIHEHFRIELGNPMSILHQEEAKKLLDVEKPERLFQFFSSITLVSRLKDQLSSAENDLDHCSQSINRKEETRKEMMITWKQMYDQLDQFKKRREAGRRKEQLSAEQHWALVEKKRLRVEGHKRELANIDNSLTNLEERKTMSKQKVNNIEDEIQYLNSTLKDFHDKNGKQALELQGATNRMKELIQMKKEVEHELACRIEGMKKMETEKRYYEDVAKKFKSKESEKMKRRLEAEIKHTMKRIAEVTDLINKDMENAEKINVEETDLEKRLKETSTKLTALSYEINEEDNKINAMSDPSSEDDRLKPFGVQATILAEKLRDANYNNIFKHSPIGPIGKYVELNEEASKSAELPALIESVLGQRLLRGYLCDNFDDFKQLRRILDKVYPSGRGEPRPLIHVTKFLRARHPIEKVVHKDYKTLIDYLDIKSNAVVFNHLVDAAKIERILICPNAEEGAKVAMNPGTMLKLLDCVVTEDYRRLYPAIPNVKPYRNCYCNKVSGMPLLRTKQSRFENELLKIRAENSRKKDVQRDLIRKKEALLREEAILEEKRLTHSQRNQTNRQRLQEWKSKLTEQKNKEEEQKDLNEEIAIQCIQKFTNDLAPLKDQIAEMEAERKKLIRDEEAAKARVVKLQNSKRKFELTREDDNMRMEDLERKLLVAKRDLNNHENGIKQALEKKEARLKEIREEEEMLKDSIKNAQEKTGKEDHKPTQTFEQIKAQLHAIDSSQISQEFDVITYKKKAMEANELFLKVKALKVEKDQVQSLWRKALSDLKDRRHNTETVANMIKTACRRHFCHLSQELAHDLGIMIDIQISNNDRTISFRDRETDEPLRIRTLSGGEKSHLQLCLIFALWSVTDPPFRALDEWDVYLDGMARSSISKKMVKMALKSKKQFFFISPTPPDLEGLDLTWEEKSRIDSRRILKPDETAPNMTE